MMDRRRALMMAQGEEPGTSDMTHWTDNIPYTNITVYNNSYYDRSSGQVKSYTGWKRTGLIPCDGASYVRFPKINTNSQSDCQYNWFFTASQQPLSVFTISSLSAYRIDIPNNAAYFAISLPNAALTQALSDGITPHA